MNPGDLLYIRANGSLGEVCVWSEKEEQDRATDRLGVLDHNEYVMLLPEKFARKDQHFYVRVLTKFGVGYIHRGVLAHEEWA